MEGKAAAGVILSMATSFLPAPASAPSTAFSSFHTMPHRERFYVELKPNETTVVSWRKLLKEAQKASTSSASEVPAGAHPALEARIAPEAWQKDCLPPPPNRFKSVIEKIEHLYKGAHSSEDNENLSDVPDDDRYDTSDSFIDDKELDDYFSVDKAKLKHSGFFINKGELEGASKLSPLSGSCLRKRKQRDNKKTDNEMVSQGLPKKSLKSRVCLSAAARKLSSPHLTSVKSNLRTPLPSMLVKQASENANVKDEELPNDELQKINLCKTQNDSSQLGNSKADMLENMSLERKKDNLTLVDPLDLSAVEKLDVMYAQKPETVLQSKVQENDISRKASTVVGLKGSFKQKLSGGDDARERDNVKSLLYCTKDTSLGDTNASIMEKAIQDLKRTVAELCPPAISSGELEHVFELEGKGRRLPRDVKQKLAKVARLAAKQGGVTVDLIERLMDILGHMIHIKTLKRNLRAMIGIALSARQEKECMLKNIKCEVTEMVKSRVSSLLAQEAEQLEGSSDDFQTRPITGYKGSWGSRYTWDQATEDRICDIYDQYIEDLDDQKGPEIRKLYSELAELWPEGWMSNTGIKYAIHRAKERRRKQTKFATEESRRKQNMSATLVSSEARDPNLSAGTVMSMPTGLLTTSQSHKPIGLAGHDDYRIQGRNIHVRGRLECAKKRPKKTADKRPGRNLDTSSQPLLEKVNPEMDTVDWLLVSWRDVQPTSMSRSR